MKLTETFVARELIFKGNIIHLSVDTVTLPNGKTATREFVHHNGAACILATTPEQQVVLVRQYRHPAGQILLEVPAGKLDHVGEDPLDCAQRELAEETPYTCDSLSYVCHFFSAPGFTNEVLHLYQAQNVVANSALSADEDEFVETVLMSKADVKAALAAHEIQDAKTLIALQHWLLQDSEG